MSANHLTPFEIVERLIGPPEAVGRAIGFADKTTYGWRRPSAARDAGDIPSARTMRSLLAYSDQHQRGLKPEHLIWGAPAAEIEALLEQMRTRPSPECPAPDLAAE